MLEGVYVGVLPSIVRSLLMYSKEKGKKGGNSFLLFLRLVRTKSFFSLIVLLPTLFLSRERKNRKTKTYC